VCPPEEVGAASGVQIDLGVDLRGRRQLDLLLDGGDLDRADEVGRPGGAEQLLGSRVWLWQLDVGEEIAQSAHKDSKLGPLAADRVRA